MVKEPKAGDLIVHSKDGKRYKIERVGRAIMVGPIFWFIDQEGMEKYQPQSLNIFGMVQNGVQRRNNDNSRIRTSG